MSRGGKAIWQQYMSKATWQAWHGVNIIASSNIGIVISAGDGEDE